MKKVRWGVLGTAKIAREWVVPAMHKAENAELVAVASRSMESASAFAVANNIPQAFGSYEELIHSGEVDAIYNPMPNHLHVPWSLEAIKAGKHVLCEKPLGLDTQDAQRLVDAANAKPELVVMEAFMYRFHPQWIKVRELIDAGELGAIRQVHASFTYFNRDAKNVRNQPGIGGGGLLDIGCYCISVARLAFGKKPVRVNGVLDVDHDFEVDVHASAILDFGDGMATFNCSTQSSSGQLVHIVGDKARLVIETPFYKRDDHPCELILYTQNERRVLPIGHHDHYTKQVEAFSDAVLNGKPAPTPLQDAIDNMQVIDAIFASSENGAWTTVP